MGTIARTSAELNSRTERLGQPESGLHHRLAQHHCKHRHVQNTSAFDFRRFYFAKFGFICKSVCTGVALMMDARDDFSHEVAAYLQNLDDDVRVCNWGTDADDHPMLPTVICCWRVFDYFCELLVFEFLEQRKFVVQMQTCPSASFRWPAAVSPSRLGRSPGVCWTLASCSDPGACSSVRCSTFTRATPRCSAPQEPSNRKHIR